jgi:3-dehydroquinate synthetase
LAVAWGIDLINFIATARNGEFASTDLKVHKFIGQYLPFSLTEFPSANDLVNMTRRDKKMSNGILNLALPKSCGDIFICPTALDDQLVNLVDAYLNNRNVYALAD